jgi:hypothetical protein
VSIQLTPDSTAARMAPMDSASSWLPQANAQPPPPMAQAPNPTRVSSMSVQPSLAVGKEVFILVLLIALSPIVREYVTGMGDSLAADRGLWSISISGRMWRGIAASLRCPWMLASVPHYR